MHRNLLQLLHHCCGSTENEHAVARRGQGVRYWACHRPTLTTGGSACLYGANEIGTHARGAERYEDVLRLGESCQLSGEHVGVLVVVGDGREGSLVGTEPHRRNRRSLRCV